MNKIDLLKDNATLKEILKDSFGGVIYDLSNKDKYDTTELIKLWDSLTGAEQETVGGLIKGAINFVKG